MGGNMTNETTERCAFLWVTWLFALWNTSGFFLSEWWLVGFTVFRKVWLRQPMELQKDEMILYIHPTFHMQPCCSWSERQCSLTDTVCPGVWLELWAFSIWKNIVLWGFFLSLDFPLFSFFVIYNMGESKVLVRIGIPLCLAVIRCACLCVCVGVCGHLHIWKHPWVEESGSKRHRNNWTVGKQGNDVRINHLALINTLT